MDGASVAVAGLRKAALLPTGTPRMPATRGDPATEAYGCRPSSSQRGQANATPSPSLTRPRFRRCQGRATGADTALFFALPDHTLDQFREKLEQERSLTISRAPEKVVWRHRSFAVRGHFPVAGARLALRNFAMFTQYKQAGSDCGKYRRPRFSMDAIMLLSSPGGALSSVDSIQFAEM